MGDCQTRIETATSDKLAGGLPTSRTMLARLVENCQQRGRGLSSENLGLLQEQLLRLVGLAQTKLP